MAKIHILTGSGQNLYQGVVHDAVPAGNNAAGVLWSTAIANSGLSTSVMTSVGNGAGQISQNELNSIQAGTLIEGVFTFQNDPNWTAAERNAELDLRATQAINDVKARLQEQLRLFGATRN